MIKYQLINKIGENAFNWLNDFRKRAKANGLDVRLCIHEGGNTGDFTIFIYDKSVKKSYMVGYDGYFRDIQFTFDHCCRLSEKWMKNYVRKNKS